MFGLIKMGFALMVWHHVKLHSVCGVGEVEYSIEQGFSLIATQTFNGSIFYELWSLIVVTGGVLLLGCGLFLFIYLYNLGRGPSIFRQVPIYSPVTVFF